MLRLFVLGVLLSTLVLSIKENSFVAQNVTDKRFIYNTQSLYTVFSIAYKNPCLTGTSPPSHHLNIFQRHHYLAARTTYDKVIKVTVNDTITQILDFTEDSEKLLGYPTRVHVAINDSIRSDYPLFVTAEQQKGVSSWELPLVVATKHAVLQFDDMARTLCPHDAGPNITSQGRPTVTLATASPENISVTIKLRRVTDFYLEVNKEVQLNVTPSTPKYYYFSFDNDPANVTGIHDRALPPFNYTIPKSVLLTMDSDDNDICAVVSIQNNSCPVFDNEKDILYTGYHFTMLSKGGITVTSTMFPKGFYVVFIVKENDEECTGVNGVEGVAVNASWTETKPITRIKNFRLKVVPAVSYTEYLIGALATTALMLLVAILGPLAAYLKCSCKEEVVVLEEAPGPSTSGISSTDNAPIINNQDSGDSDAASDDEFQQKSLPQPLNLADLSRARHTAHIRRSDRYFWSALTVAVVYALPVVQLLLTYQRMVFQTGDQDVCYYNFLCAHPLGPLSDFNHVFTNIGYVILGLAFMMQIRCRQMRGHQYQDRGIPQHHGLFYSMGLALIMEGVLSACYHLCPNKMNFQFDSSFMYVIAVLCIIKLYQNRHPDVNASAHATFMLIALVMAIGLFGIMYPSVGFWVLFTILHLIVCFVLALKIYYFGRFKIETSVATRAWLAVKEQGWHAFRPNYPARAILIAVAILANCVIAGYGVYEHKTDFARHLLVILMGNAILYTLGYVVMKLFHREQLRAPAVLYLLLAVVAWSLAAHLFLLARTKWSQMPAISRSHNAPCAALNMFDTHDLWHLASAAAIFLSFNALLVLDDPLINVPRDKIPVF